MKRRSNFSYHLTLHVLLLIVSCFTLTYCLVCLWWYGLFLVPLIIYQCCYLVILNKKILNEFDQLVETIRYHDFSRRFNIKKSNPYIREIREGANEICETVSAISQEKEIQYQYLQTIIELVDTGILSYQTKNGNVVWMNQSLKNMLGVPHLKNFHALRKRNPALYDSLQELGNRKSAILPILREHNQDSVLVASSMFVIQNTEYRLLAFHDVNKVLDEAESKAWQRLLNVMTHEIMNSVAPISSLAETLKNIMIKEKEKPGSGTLEDIELGVDTIMRRSQGLLSFAETYRNLSKITQLNITRIHAEKLFEHIYQLMQPSLKQKNIELDIVLDNPQMTFDADMSLIEQVLINLIVNAIETVKTTPEPRIILSAALENERPVIKVIDNGKGIPDEIVDKIFVPFFSTRKQGNGIGLSLCKQIMMLHNGNIRMNTVTGKGSCFSLLFQRTSTQPTLKNNLNIM